jgi:hypothetical protein
MRVIGREARRKTGSDRDGRILVLRFDTDSQVLHWRGLQGQVKTNGNFPANTKASGTSGN